MIQNNGQAVSDHLAAHGLELLVSVRFARQKDDGDADIGRILRMAFAGSITSWHVHVHEDQEAKRRRTTRQKKQLNGERRNH
jgi:hypothetical protein